VLAIDQLHRLLRQIPGTHNLIRILFRFWAAFLGFEDAPHHFLQTTKESFVSQRPASATVLACVSQFLFWHGTLQKGIPIVDHRQQARNFHQRIVSSR